MVLAVAEIDGVKSELHRREITEELVDRPVELTSAVVWQPERGFKFQTTRTAYEFINRCEKYAESAGGLRIVVGESHTAWVDLNLSNDIEFDSATLAQAVDQLRRHVPDGEVQITAQRIRYVTGQHFLDYVSDAKETFRRDEVKP